MSEDNSELKPGDSVAFDIEGSDISPYGYGTVVKMWGKNPMVKPDHPITAHVYITNIRKVDKKPVGVRF